MKAVRYNIVLLGMLIVHTSWSQPVYQSTPVFSNRSLPVRLGFAPDSSGRLFYLELHNGNVKFIRNDSTFTWLHVDVNPSGERGLLGFAFDPAFSSTKHIYIYYTVPGNPPSNRVERYTEVGSQADTSTRLLLYEHTVATPCGTFSNHNAGALAFGLDSLLYVSTGENNCDTLAQQLTTPQGKILRIRPDVPSPFNADSSNPFFDDGNPATGNDDRIFAWGLRNPFGLIFSPLDSAFYSTENGPDCNDEINRILIGRNYGWRRACRSGTGHCECSQESPYTPPLVSITPTIAPTGLLGYNGTHYPELNGKMLFVDNNQGLVRLGTFTPDRDSLVVSVIHSPLVGALFDIVQGPDGFIYFSSASTIHRLLPLPTSVDNPEQPGEFSLDQNYPNPFNPVTDIRFQIAEVSNVTLKVYDVLGRETAMLANGIFESGRHHVEWQAHNIPSGIYYYRIFAEPVDRIGNKLFIQTRMMVIIK